MNNNNNKKMCNKKFMWLIISVSIVTLGLLIGYHFSKYRSKNVTPSEYNFTNVTGTGKLVNNPIDVFNATIDNAKTIDEFMSYLIKSNNGFSKIPNRPDSLGKMIFSDEYDNKYNVTFFYTPITKKVFCVTLLHLHNNTKKQTLSELFDKWVNFYINKYDPIPSVVVSKYNDDKYEFKSPQGLIQIFLQKNRYIYIEYTSLEIEQLYINEYNKLTK